MKKEYKKTKNGVLINIKPMKLKPLLDEASDLFNCGNDLMTYINRNCETMEEKQIDSMTIRATRMLKKADVMRNDILKTLVEKHPIISDYNGMKVAKDGSHIELLNDDAIPKETAKDENEVVVHDKPQSITDSDIEKIINDDSYRKKLVNHLVKMAFQDVIKDGEMTKSQVREQAHKFIDSRIVEYLQNKENGGDA